MRRPILVSTLLALAVFAVTLHGTFVYDDISVVVRDDRFGPPIAWAAFWTDGYNSGADNLYRPLVSTTYAVQRWLHGTTAWPFHAVNWLLHAFVSGLVAWLAGRLARASRMSAARSRGVAWISGVLFAVHPVHVEAVANVVGRAELMCAAGVLGAAGLCMRPLTPRRAAAAFACFVVALLSKEQGLVAPLAIGVCALAARSRGATNPRERGPASALFVGVMLAIATIVFLRENVLHLKFWWMRSFLDPWIQPLVDVGPRDRVVGAIAIAGRYLQLLAAPVSLRIDYGGPIVPGVTRLTDLYLWLGVGAIGLWLAIAIVAWRRRDAALGAALLSFAVLYGMIANAVSLIGVNVAERVMYLPSAFFLIVVALLVVRLPRRAIVVATGVVASLFAVRSATYAWQWNDALRLYEYALAVEPRSLKAALLAMQARIDRGDLDAAERLGRHAVALDPTYDDPYCRLAMVQMLRGDLDGAEALLKHASSINPAGRAQTYYIELQKRRAATRPTVRDDGRALAVPSPP